MRLGEDLRDDAGQMLLPRGTELSESSLRSLERRGITVLPILEEKPVDEGALLARREASRQRLIHLFRRATDPTSQILLHLMQEYRQEHPQ